MKYASLFIAPILLSTHTLLPIRPKSAHHINSAVTIATAALTAAFTKSVLWSAGAATSSYIVSSYLTHQCTPKGRFAKALHKATQIYHNPFATNNYGQDQLFIQELQDYYTDQYWLITAHEDIDRLITKGYQALEFIDRAKKDSDNDFHMLQECEILQKKIRFFLVNLTNALRRIKNHTDFTAQRASYNQLLLAKERLAVEREKAHAYYMQARAQMRKADAQHAKAKVVRTSCCGNS
jgi:hypothetical protein